MGRQVTVKVVFDSKQAERDAQEFERKVKTSLEQPRDALGRFKKDADAATAGIKSMRSAAGELQSSLTALRGVFAGLGIATVVAGLKQFADAAIQAAINIDKQINSLKALTGSAEAAKQRFAELFALAQRSPGLTTNLAATLDAQLRIFDVNVKTIDRLLPVIGRLNAISPLGDPRQFVNNLTQLITQNFERQDLKELVGASPIAGKLIKQIFDVDNPTNAEAIRAAAKRMGVTTVERLAEELINAGENNQALKNATESLAGQFEKLQERINIAIAPIGDELLKVIGPAFKEIVELIERDAPKITKLLEDNREELLTVAAAFVTAADAVGRLIVFLGQLDKSLGVVRNLAALSAAVVVPGGVFEGPTLIREIFRRSEANAPVFGEFESATRPSGEELLRRALGAGDIQAVRRAQQIIAEEERNRPDGRGLGGGGDGEISKAAKKRAEELVRQLTEARKNSAEALDVFMKGNIEDLEGVTKIINQANAQGKKDRDFRARRLIEGRETRQALTAQFEAAEVAELERTSRRGLNRSGRSIGESFSRGALTPGEAEALSQVANREFANRLREILALEQERGNLTQARKEDLEDEIALYDRLGAAISDTERFMQGFNSQVETSGDIWARFGQNVSNAFRNVKDLFNGLKSAVLGFFNDLLGNSIQNLVRGVLGPLFGGGGGGGGGLLGNLFRTPTFAGGGGISAPPSVSGGLLSGIFGGGGGGGGTGGGGTLSGSLGDFIGAGVPRTAGQIAGGGFGGFNFGQIGQSLANAAPLLGLTLGAGLGGRSVGGNILGAAGGLLTSTFLSTTLGAPGALGSLAPALFSNPLTAIAGAGLLVGAVLLGKAKQRKKDEEASGQMLTQALEAISQLRVALDTNQIDGSQAAAIFENQILGQFKQGISTLKTKSVVESRLTNQVSDLRRTYNDVIVPGISAQSERRRIAAEEEAARIAKAERAAFVDSRLIPEFATGGITRGGLAIMHPNEMVLTVKHQRDIQALAGADIFNRVGVPGVRSDARFDNGGIMPAGGSPNLEPIEIKLAVNVGMSKSGAQEITATGLSGPKGRQLVVKVLGDARTEREA